MRILCIREKRGTEKETDNESRRECISADETNCRKICGFIRMQALFIFYFHKCAFKPQILSVNTTEEYQSHLVLKLLLFRMKNTTYNHIRWESMVSSWPHISKELHTYLPLLLLQYISFYLLLLKRLQRSVLCSFPVIADRGRVAHKYRQKKVIHNFSENEEDTKSTTCSSEFREFVFL